MTEVTAQCCGQRTQEILGGLKRNKDSKGRERIVLISAMLFVWGLHASFGCHRAARENILGEWWVLCPSVYAHRQRLFSDGHALGISTICLSETKAVSPIQRILRVCNAEINLNDTIVNYDLKINFKKCQSTVK